MNTQGIGQCKGSYNGLKGARFEGDFHGIPCQEVMTKGFPGKFWGSIVGRLLNMHGLEGWGEMGRRIGVWVGSGGNGRIIWPSYAAS